MTLTWRQLAETSEDDLIAHFAEHGVNLPRNVVAGIRLAGQAVVDGELGPDAAKPDDIAIVDG